ncbi:MAG TPA: cytidylate kinase-like family protein [Bellilinea sp.]
MDVITISRQLGSLGFQVGQAVAAKLNYRLVWRDLINQAAIRSGAPDVALAMIDELNLLGLVPTPEQFKAYIQVVGQVIHELAVEGGIVIVGRGGQVVLRNDPRVLHVRILSPLDVRIQRICDYRGISPEAASAQIETSDKTRKNYLRRAYQTDWDDPSMYDLVLNTGRMSLATAAEIICQAVALPYESDPTNAKIGEEEDL